MGVFATLALAGLIAVTRYHPKGATPETAQVGTTTLTSPGSPPDASNSPVSSTNYKDGTYTGQTVDVGYGPVQVQAIVSGGRIKAVNFLQMPDDHDRSSQISAMAKPILLHETLLAQSANVDIASGATQTSEGYIQSLQDALSSAKA